MNPKNYIKEKIKEALAISLKTEKDQIYAFSIYVYDEEDDPRFPTIQFGYNTEEYYQSEIENASSAEEARWNFAFWPQNRILCIGGYEDDPQDQERITAWIKELQLYYTDEEEDEDFDLCLDKGSEITEHFVQMLVEMVQELQKDLELSQPILIHELEYYEQIVKQNQEANGEEKVRELTNWIHSF